MKSREIKFDNLKGILIILVVFGHFLINYHSYASSSIIKIIYLFHMPFFIFISGYFSKKNQFIFKYFFLYLIINSFYIYFLYLYENNPINFIDPYYQMWYLLSLTYWNLINRFINLNSYKMLLVFTILSLLIGYCPLINNTLALSRTIGFFPFFISGVIYNNIKLTNNNISIKKVALSVFIISISIILVLNNKISIDMLLLDSYTNNIDFLYRIIIFLSAYSIIYLSLIYIPNKKIHFINRLGYNTLSIYIFHRVIQIIMMDKCFSYTNDNKYILIFLLFSLLLSFLLSLNIFNMFISKLFQLSKIIYGVFSNSIVVSLKNGYLLIFVLTIFILFIPFFFIGNEKSDILYDTASKNEQNILKNAIKISFIGDLILLKKQIDYNENNKIKNYDYIFEDSKEIINNSNYSIGVLEGPVAGKKLKYTNSNLDDNVDLELNFPIEFLKSIKSSGIDLVTISNNHLLDKGKIGVINTINNLEKNNFNYIGGYKNIKDKDDNKIKFVDIDGLKVAILSYTYGINNYEEKELLKNYKYLTSYLVNPESIYFSSVKKEVRNDFLIAKKSNPDLIIVLPHMGIMFSKKTSYYQDIWNKVFVDNGADIVFGDHSHAIQPIQYINNSLIINCPGNFINSYLKYDGDLGAIANAYVDKNSKKVVAASIVPTLIENENGMYRNRIINKYHNLEIPTKKKINKLNTKNKKITKTMLGTKIDFKNSLSEYYYFKEGYKRLKNTIIDEKNINKEGIIYNRIKNSRSITFIGDSITEGSKNGGYGWYEPITNYFDSKNQSKRICVIAKGGATTTTINKLMKTKKCDTDLYIIAIGTNNIRYDFEKVKKPNEYINSLNKIIKNIHSNNVIIIAPFISNDDDIFFTNVKRKKHLYEEYNKYLTNYCVKNNYLYVNINKKISSLMKSNEKEKYIIDYIHPNNELGIKFYAESILSS